jgi:4-amino-4-deoxy-L-arabinose transferase-like glycosyltransferase
MRLILALVLVGFVSFFLGLGAVGLIGPDESRYAQVARGMLERADWITPHLQGAPWLDKPPLYYWAAAGGMILLGETETAARLPAAVAAFTTCLAIAFLGTRWFGFAAGLRSALVLAASLGMVLYGRAAIMDSLLTLALTIGLGAYALYVTERRSLSWLVTAFAAIGAGVLAKGPIAVVLSLLIILPFRLLDRAGLQSRSRRLTVPTATHAIVSVASFLVVVIPWHAAILQRMGWEFVEVFFLQHNVDRFLTTVHRHPGPIYYYLPVLALALFPWSAFVPAAIARAMRGIEARRTFLLLWIVSPLVFFSLSGAKLPGYLLPVLPPFALLIGLLWVPADESRKEETTAWMNRSLAFHVAWCLVLGAAAILGFPGRMPEMVTASRWLALLVVGLGAGAYVAGRRRPGRAYWSLTASSVLLTLLMVFYLAPTVEPHQSLKTLATKGLAELKPGERVICYRAFYPRAHFYTRDRLGAIWTLEEFRIRAAEWGRIVTLTEPEHYREIAEDASLEARVIARSGNRLLVEARAASAASR